MWFRSGAFVARWWLVGSLMVVSAGCAEKDGGPDSGVTVRCGDGVKEGDERCDDHNTAPGDGCASDCTIEPGWECPSPGAACSLIDNCAGAPCLNGASCAGVDGGYTCACAAGFSGTNCETNLDDCSPNPCLNGATCADGVDAYTCACAAGFSGANCEIDIDECASAPCLNGATCADGINAYTCTCAGGFIGTNCETELDECEANPCFNGGSCADGVNSYTCTCATGFTGTNCQTNIDDCAATPCLNGSACTDGVNAYTCTCATGFSGTVCETNLNDCAPNPCLNNGACVDGVASYTCQCPSGYGGDNCEIEINECSPNPCANGGSCTDGVASYTCACAANFTGAQCQSCPGTLANCDNNASNGCEVNLKSDAQHCNACGFACTPGNICSNGACLTPPTTVQPGTMTTTNAAHSPLAPAVADVNRDGKLDVLVANAESGSITSPLGSLSVFLGNGDATLQAEQYYVGAPLSSNAVIAVDVNEDGWLDAVTVDGQANLPTTEGSITVFRNLGASAPGTFGPLVSFPTGARGSVHLCTGDFNHDNHADLATVSVSSDQVSVLLGTGTGSFGMPTLLSIPSTGGVQSSIGCRDLNGDGFDDLVATSPSSARVSVLLNLGNGSFFTTSYSNSQNGQTAGVAFGDADRDGKLDLLSNGSAGRYLFFFKGNGDGTFATGVHSTASGTTVSNSALGLTAADFNHDGKLDAYILVTTSSGGVRPVTGDGAGGFLGGSVTNTGTSPGLNAITNADLDGNGYEDLVLTNQGSASVVIVRNSL